MKEKILKLIICASSLLMLIGCTNNEGIEIVEDEAYLVGHGESSPPEKTLIIGEVTIIEHEHSDSLADAYYLTLDEAARIGLEYISEFFVFDYSRDESYLELTHISNTENEVFNYENAPIWYGVLSFSDQVNSLFVPPEFEFSIHAKTGQWLRIARLNFDFVNDYHYRELPQKTPGEWQALENELRIIFPYPEAEELDTILLFATAGAQKHFRDSELTSIVLDDDWVVWLKFKAENEHGEIIYVHMRRSTQAPFEFSLPLQ